MSFSDMTRSYSTFPSRSQTATPLQISPIVVSTKASEGPSNVPGSSIAAMKSMGSAAALSPSTGAASSSRGGGVNTDLALGLGLGLGISALIAVFVAIYVLKSRKAQRADFERRADVIRDTVETAKARPSVN
ncbi:hypothetical protein JCM16303_002957 [Sporobolomyces ruberrimus]